MGGHGGLNILPQKRWNVYRFDNMEKVRLDEEAAAKEEQLKREQARKRDAEFRIEKMRTAKGLEPLVKEKIEESKSESVQAAEMVERVVAVEDNKVDSKHINLFEGIKIFDIVEKVKKVEKEDERPKKKRKEEPVRVVTAEDEKFRLGYGVTGKGVKLPWYMSKRNDKEEDRDLSRCDDKSSKRKDKNKSSGTKKKSLEELREERLAREKHEKAREKALLASGRDRPVPEDRYYRR